MSDKSAIEWTDTTWNPVVGCTRVSPGCEHCYAERLTHRLGLMGKSEYQGLAHKPHADGVIHWTGEVRCLPERLEEPLRWKRPRRVFVNSMSDLFHESVPDEFLDRVFAVMMLASQHTFQVLTKRPERMRQYLSDEATAGRVSRAADRLTVAAECARLIYGHHWEPRSDWPLLNVWAGVSVENQAAADERIPLLLQTPAAVRFLSCEPLLGPLDLNDIRVYADTEDEFHMDALSMVDDNVEDDHVFNGATIDWVIVGGESGGPPHSRLVETCPWTDCLYELGKREIEDCCGNMEGAPYIPKLAALDWVRSIRDQCQAAGVPFLLKQWGGPTPKSGGRTLDGIVWNQFPDGKGGVVSA